MRKIIPLLFILFWGIENNLQAAYLHNVPVTVTQPSGTVIHCFASGDEFYNWLHDANNFTIIKNKITGYYSYAEIVDGQLLASEYTVGSVDPVSVGIDPGLKVIPERSTLKSATIEDKSYAPKTGDYNNIVIFIRFADQDEFTEAVSLYEDQFNGLNQSLRGYFAEVSREQLNVASSLYPVSSGSSIISYQDAQVRNYYVPYDAITNQDGYTNDEERTVREHNLLENAINAVKPELENSGINFDSDDDGYVDNVCFIVQGSPEGWSELLWPHKWTLYSNDVTIAGNQVWEYNFQLSEVTDVSVLCHEMFHTLGAPDLYHYNEESANLVPVGAWGLMANNTAQHMLAWMKYQYGNWFDEIPVITENGTYKLPAVGNSSFACYKIPVPESSTEFFMVEYRKRTGYDTNLYWYYDEGLLVYRVNTAVTGGNRNGPPDEVYILRPGIDDNAPNGSLGDATFSADQGRTLLNVSTDPLPLLSNESNTSLSIYDVGLLGDSIEFKVGNGESVDPVYTLTCNDVTINNGVITACSYDFANPDINIPDTLCGQVVTGLGYRLFRFNPDVIRSVRLPAGLTRIEESAFEHNSLESVDFSRCNNLYYIGPLAFMSNNLTQLALPDSVFIGGGAFNGNTITFLNGQAFDGLFYEFTGDSEDHSTLISYAGQSGHFVIPSSVERIADHALNTCGLTSVDFSECTGLQSIGFRAFFGNNIPSIDLSSCVNLNQLDNGALLFAGLNSIDLTPCINLQQIGANALGSNNFSAFVLPTPQVAGKVFDYWEDGYGNQFEGGAMVSDLLTSYVSSFQQDSLFDLNSEVTVQDAMCNGWSGSIYIEISGGLGGSYGYGGQTVQALTDGSSYRVTVYDLNYELFVEDEILDDDANSIAFDLTPGAYFISVEDAIGDELQQMIFVSEPAPLELIVDQYSVTCPEDTVVVSLAGGGGNEPYLYSINRNGASYIDATTNSNFVIEADGWYEFFVRDANGCVAADSMLLEKPEGILFDIQDVSCFSDTLGIAKIVVQNNSPGQMYQVAFSYYENGELLMDRVTEVFESEIYISELLFEDTFTDRYYTFRVINADDCISETKTMSFYRVSEPLLVSTNVLNVNADNADIQIQVTGGTPPYRITLDGVEIQELYQNVTTWGHALFVNDAHECYAVDSFVIEPNSVCPQYFHPVWEGNGVYEPMNIYIIDAKLDGIDLEPGDQIGVFDYGRCVGQGIVSQPINQQNILSIVVSADDGTGNGYVLGDQVMYKIWKCNSGEEISNVDATCFTNQLVPVECSDFQSGATSFVQLNGTAKVNFATGFQPGWNLFSLPVLPDSIDIEFTFNDLIQDNTLIKIQDESGASLEDMGIFGDWQNNIGIIRLTEGYKVKVAEFDSLYCSGTPVEYPFAIPLKPDWNLVGFPSFSYVNGMEVVEQLIDRGTLIKVQNEQGKSIENLGVYGGWQNFIGNFWAGEGFKLKVNNVDTLWIYESYPKSLSVFSSPIPTQHFKTGFAGNGVDHMNFNLVELSEELLNIGDEISVYDGATCVGAIVVTADHLKNKRVSVPASAADNSGTPGFADGNQYSLRIWSAENNREEKLEPEYISGAEQFTKHESVLLSLKNAQITSVNESLLNPENTVKCYPNPFSEAITIEIGLEQESSVTVTVVNQLGQEVRKLANNAKMSKGIFRLDWDGRNTDKNRVSEGIYLITIQVDDQLQMKKIVRF